ncbi:MAG: hypothetical protein WBD55_06280 [Dehalococcoidia bacterium]
MELQELVAQLLGSPATIAHASVIQRRLLGFQRLDRPPEQQRLDVEPPAWLSAANSSESGVEGIVIPARSGPIAMSDTLRQPSPQASFRNCCRP